MSIKTSFSFEGFTQLRDESTSTHDVVVGTLKTGEEVFMLHLVRNATLPFKAEFLLVEVWDRTEKKRLWRFKDIDFSGNCFLVQTDLGIAIALVGRGKQGEVERVIPFKDFSSHQPTDLRKLIGLKKAAAKALDRRYQLTETEQRLVKIDQARDEELRKKRKEALEAERQAEKAAALKKRAAREARVAALKARPRVEVFAEGGKVCHGTPVTETEWQSLPHGTYVVLVQSYDDESGECGEAFEFFWIQKNGGRPRKERLTPVSFNRSTDKASGIKLPEPVRTVLIERDGNVFEAKVFETIEVVRQAVKIGLNGGTYVTSEDRVDADKAEIFSATSEGLKTVGNLTVL